jgi:hypothetical protein
MAGTRLTPSEIDSFRRENIEAGDWLMKKAKGLNPGPAPSFNRKP